MPHVHSQRYLRLATVPAEVSFADQQPGKKAEAEIVRHWSFSVVHVPAPKGSHS
jgi:hypothetical protein